MSNHKECDLLDGFAKFIGVEGSDLDLFYEMYYDLDSHSWELEFEEEPVPLSYKS